MFGVPYCLIAIYVTFNLCLALLLEVNMVSFVIKVRLSFRYVTQDIVMLMYLLNALFVIIHQAPCITYTGEYTERDVYVTVNMQNQ